MFATFESRQKGGYARAAKIRERRELVEQIKLERLADAPTPRRRRRGGRRRSAYGLREPFAAAYPVGAPARPVLVAPTRVLPVNAFVCSSGWVGIAPPLTGTWRWRGY